MILKEYHNSDLQNSLKHEGNPKEGSTRTMRKHISQKLTILFLELFIFIIVFVLVNANARSN
jgi:hypothetical protein